MSAIIIEDFHKNYQDLAAVKGISLTIDRGELFGLIGPDGAGKTTLMRSVCTLLKPSRGLIRVAGYDAAREILAVRKILGYMPQRFSLYQDLTVSQNLQFFADLFQVPANERDSRLERLYQFSRLAPFKNRLAGALSGGMKQKLALSCALIHTPEILVLDEPTYGVDPLSRQEFWEIIAAIQKEGATILVSTAYMEEAEICDRVALMHMGKIVSVGFPHAIKKKYPYPLYRLQGNDLAVLRNYFRSLEQVHDTQLFGAAIHVSFLSQPKTEEWASWQEKLGDNLRLWHQHPPSMEDVFMELIREENNG